MDYESALKPNPYYNDTHHEWRRQLRRFVEKEIEPNVNAWDREDQYLPRDVFRKAGELGIYGIGYPEEFGGLGSEFDIFHDLLAVEEFHRPGSAAILTTVFVPIGGLPPINAMATLHVVCVYGVSWQVFQA